MLVPIDRLIKLVNIYQMRSVRKISVANIFGTRPEAIKLSPVLWELGTRADTFETCNIVTAQHVELLEPLLGLFDIAVDHKLDLGRRSRSLNELLSCLLEGLDPIIRSASPDLVVVQGDTTTALAGALTAHHHRIPLVHVEAGLRSGNSLSPFPEEMNRRLITNLASFHMAATAHNAETLRSEGIPQERIFVTGNPVVDALHWVLEKTRPSAQLNNILQSFSGNRLITLTTHRRESWGEVMRENFRVIGDFCASHDDVAVIFPMHPNPAIRREWDSLGPICSRMQMIDPLIYPDFIHLLSRSWLVISDSGGVQEEVPTLGKALLILRENTERSEAIDAGFARLVGGCPGKLAEQLEMIAANDDWITAVKKSRNPFGDGHSAKAVVDVMANVSRRRQA